MKNQPQVPSHVNKFYFPLISFIVSLSAVLMIYSLPPELGSALLAINIIVLCGCLIIPILSFYYSKKILKNSSKRILYTLLNSFASGLSGAIYAIFGYEHLRERILYALIDMLVIFIWSEIWGVFGLIGKQDKKNGEEQTNDNAIGEENNNEEGYKKILYPVMSFVLSLFIEAVVLIPKGDHYLFIVSSVLLIWILLFMPLVSFLYPKMILKNGKNKIVYTLLNSLAICLSYLFLLFLELHSYWVALGIFAWSEVWGLLGLIGKRDKKENEISEEQ